MATIRKVIEELEKIANKYGDQTPVYFDCPNCGKANEFSSCGTAALVETKRERR